LKKIIGLAVLAALVYFGVKWLKDWNPPQEQTPSGYTKTLQREEQRAVSVTRASQVQGLTDAVWKFKALKERLPNSLRELVEAGLVDHVPAGFNYDPATGTVTVAP